MIDCPHCGAEFDETPKRNKRSLPQHRRYFALIKAAYEHWPENNETQFTSAKECRKWLQMKAGHYKITARIPLAGMKPERAKMLAEAAIRAAGSYAVPEIRGDSLYVYSPLSIKIEALAHKRFCELNRTVEEIIAVNVGVTAEKLLKEWHNEQGGLHTSKAAA